MGRRGGPASMPGVKAKDFKGTLRTLMQYIGRYKVSVFIVMILAVLSTIFNVLGPRVLGYATTAIFSGLTGMVEGSTQGIDFAYVGRIISVLLVIYIASAIFLYLQGFLMSKVTTEITYNMRRDVSQKINRLPLSYFDKHSYGEVLTLITNDIDTINQNLNQGITQIITSVTTVVGIMAIMFTMNWILTLIVICILPVSFLVVSAVIKRSQKYFTAQQEYLGHVNAHVEEIFGSHIVVKAFNGEQDAIDRFDGMNDKLYDSAWRSQFMSGIMMPMMNFITNISYVIVCILGGYMAMVGSLTVGEIQAFLQYVRSFNQPISQLAQISAVLQTTMAAAERVFTFLDQPDESPDTTHPASTKNVRGGVEFDAIDFGYVKDRPIITDFSAKVEPGQKIAIVGPTGAGKTTLVKLLMRFYDVDSGAIRIDGTDIKDFTRDDLRKMFGMVLQDAWLESGTIADNIRYGKLDATDDEVVRAAKTAQVDHFVRTLQDGYNTEIDEESSNVSQGQKQLLTIARVILEDPKMLILDEATSSVDTRTEAQIQKAMDALMKDRTSFIIAHRLSTIRNADLILVMKDGNIVEQGTHDDLLKKGGFYSELYKSQFDNAAEMETDEKKALPAGTPAAEAGKPAGGEQPAADKPEAGKAADARPAAATTAAPAKASAPKSGRNKKKPSKKS